MSNQVSRTILVVEDDLELQAVMTCMLEFEGYVVATADNGLEALCVVEKHSPDLILLDIHMPVMDGWECARQLRQNGYSEIPIVLVTASVDAKEIANDIGAAAWVRKPFDLDALLEIVQEYANSSVHNR